MPIDKLQDIHSKQKTLQNIIQQNNKDSFLFSEDSKERFLGAKIFDIATCIVHELIELQRETNWKHWKKEKPLDKNRMAEEIADLDSFLTQLCLEVGIDADQRYKNYCDKNLVNIKRQKEENY